MTSSAFSPSLGAASGADLPHVINAWGTPTPFGVSRADAAVAEAVAAMLQRHVVMSQLQAQVAARVAQWAGAPAACVTHCTAAAVTLSVAACMAGADAARVAQLPDTTGLPGRVVMLAAHQVNYGHAITQAVRLAGARVVACGDDDALRTALAEGGVACVLAVESHLAPGSGPDVTARLRALAQAAGVPLVLDAAAQDRRLGAASALARSAELVLVSAQKYLRAPTAGLVLGTPALVAAVDAQHAGIGRAMKPTKEALAGVLAAVDLRARESGAAWLALQQRKVEAVVLAARQWPGVTVTRESDPQGNGFERLRLQIDPARAGVDAATLVQRLRSGDPVVAVAPHHAARGQIGLELTGVDERELPLLCAQIAGALAPQRG
jgi:uncharacterized pyridoxal phosphate-dependent enzyme